MRLICSGIVLAALAGCSATSNGLLAPEPTPFETPINASEADVQGWRLAGVRVSVPQDLRVSQNPNIRFPDADIVWWGDPPGDRRQQVAGIVQAAVTRAGQDLRGPGRRVYLDVGVQLFHAVTPRARISGSRAWHDILFSLRVVDASTGEVLAEERAMSADLKAFQGDLARRAVANGQTQKVRISARITEVVRAWFASAAG